MNYLIFLIIFLVVVYFSRRVNKAFDLIEKADIFRITDVEAILKMLVDKKIVELEDWDMAKDWAKMNFRYDDWRKERTEQRHREIEEILRERKKK